MRMRSVGTRAFLVAVGVTAAMAACGGRSSLELPSPDGGLGTDAAASDDAASVVEAGTDAGIDGEPPWDGALDASPVDSSFDGPITDGGPEVSSDAALDAPTDAPVRVLIIHTREEFAIARETWRLTKSSSNHHS